MQLFHHKFTQIIFKVIFINVLIILYKSEVLGKCLVHTYFDNMINIQHFPLPEDLQRALFSITQGGNST